MIVSIIELFLVAMLLIGILNEEKLIAWERKQKTIKSYLYAAGIWLYNFADSAADKMAYAIAKLIVMCKKTRYNR